MSAAPRTVRAGLIIIGNEILSGRTQDSNIAWIAQRLGALGVRLAEVRIVADVDDAIIAAVNALRATHDYVFTTGGIGPTHDDITARAVAAALGRTLVRHAGVVRLLEAHYAPRGIEVGEARLKMADLPDGTELIENPVSGAPGFQVENVFVMAGIPKIMQAQFASLSGRLAGGVPLIARTVACNLPESELAASLGAIQDQFTDVEIGSYPFSQPGGFGVKLVLRATDGGRLDAAVRLVSGLIEDLGDTPAEETGG